LKLIVGLSGNLPRHVSGHSFDSNYNSFFRPFFQTLYSYPSIPAVIYFSGLWYKWFDDYHPEVNTLIVEMQKRNKQVELLGGGYYEPFLPMLQISDRVGQLDALTTAIRQKFGKKPRGCKLNGASWDNSLISSLKSCGIEYVFLDRKELLSTSQLKGNEFDVTMTEEQGKILRFFPLADRMLEKVSECTPDDFIQRLMQIRGKDPVVSLFFDVNNFAVRNFAWLDEFFAKIVSNKSIELTTPAQYLKSEPVLAKEYYQGMTLYKKVLLESEEFDNLYDKMSFVQTLANSIRGDKYKKKAALDELWKGQGYFAAFSCESSRKAYAAFIECEKLARSQGVFISSLINTDFKLRGYKQFLYQGDYYNAYVQRSGGSIFEYDNLQPSWNYVNYCVHNQEPGLFSDRFYDVENFRGDVESIPDAVTDDLSDVVYDVDDYDRENKQLTLSCRHKREDFNVRLIKAYRFFNSMIAVGYEAVNLGGTEINLGYITSFNIALYCHQNVFKPLLSEKGITLMDKTKTINIIADRPCDFTYRNIFDLSGRYVATLVYAIGQTGNLEPGKSSRISFEFSCH